SGESLLAFAKGKEIPYPTMVGWRKALLDGKASGRPKEPSQSGIIRRKIGRAASQPTDPLSSNPAFATVELLQDALPGSPHRMEIEFPSGVLVRLPCEVSPSALSNILKALRPS
ncbi:MAG: hypothetical protein DRI90_28585, partial [Deltaproteobacteria bacterium]